MLGANQRLRFPVAYHRSWHDQQDGPELDLGRASHPRLADGHGLPGPRPSLGFTRHKPQRLVDTQRQHQR